MTSILNAPSTQNLLAQLQAATRKAAGQATGQKAGQGQDAVMAMLEKNNPEQAKKLKEQQDSNARLLQQMSSARTEQNAARKEAARQKVDRLKAQIQMLKMMSGGDPKATARRAAQLSRELATAAKEYASAGGTAAATATAGATATPPAATADANAAASGQAAAAGTAQGATAQPAPPPAAPVDADTANTAASGDGETATQDSSESTDPAATARAAIQEKVNEESKKQGERAADEKFAEDVRKLLGQLKNIIRSAKDKMRAQGDSGETQDTRDADTALRDTERALTDITTGGAQAGVFSVSITV